MSLRKKRIQISAPDSIIAEQFRDIRTNLYFAQADRKHRTLLVTSPGFGEGKSMSAIHLAASLAQQGQQVLLVDGNLRKPVLHTIFQVNRELGLSDVLRGDASMTETVQPTQMDNLFLMAGGSIPFNPAELLGSSAMKLVLDEALAGFDMIVFDSPPVLAVTDSRILASLCDGVILVLRLGRTKAETVQETKRLLDFIRANVLGAILHPKN